MQTSNHVVTSHAGVRAVLDSPDFAVPPVPRGGRPGGIEWLRANVARFSNGPTHERRRSLGVAALATVRPVDLRQRANQRTATLLQESGEEPVDLMAGVARVVPVELLASALGIPAARPEAVAEAARAYHPHVTADAAADKAVALLVDACGGVADEATAALIGLLVQACDATAGLVGNALLAMLRLEIEAPIELILAETLRHDPPVLATRRVAAVATGVGGAGVDASTVVLLDIAAANRDPAVFADPDRFDPAREGAERHLTFGAGPRSCPGHAHALAIAAGIVEAAHAGVLASGHVRYEAGYQPSGQARVLSRLVVSTQ